MMTPEQTPTSELPVDWTNTNKALLKTQIAISELKEEIDKQLIVLNNFVADQLKHLK